MCIQISFSTLFFPLLRSQQTYNSSRMKIEFFFLLTKEAWILMKIFYRIFLSYRSTRASLTTKKIKIFLLLDLKLWLAFSHSSKPQQKCSWTLISFAHQYRSHQSLCGALYCETMTDWLNLILIWVWSILFIFFLTHSFLFVESNIRKE